MVQKIQPHEASLAESYWHRNRSAEILYGYSASEALGQNVLQLLLCCDRDEDAARQVINRITLGETWSGTIPVKNKLGKQFAAFVTNSPLYDDKDNFLGVVAVVADSQSFLQNMPFPSQETYPSSRQPKQVTSANNCIDSQEPLHVKVSSKIWNMVSKITSKVRSKQKTNENTVDHVRDSRYLDQGFSGNLVFNHTKSTTLSEASSLRGGIPPWKTVSSELSRFTTISASSTSSGRCTGSTSTSNGPPDKFDIGTDPWHFDIMWDDLRIREQIGRGSCGTVYRGFWFGSDVAVKVFSKFDYSDDLLHSFKQEVLLMKRLRHPNVLLFMGAVTSHQRHCIVTEFLPRGSLFQLLKNTALDWRRRVLMALDIARGMNYLHVCNPPIIHRDLKSSNLLVDKNWTVKVADFGLSRIKHSTFLSTKSGNGTPQWMAPEVMRDEPSDEKSDVYSFGVILWELATQKIPWDNLTAFQVIGTVGYMDKRLDMGEVTDTRWASLIESCWNSEPKCRPTFKELLEKLTAIQKQYAVQRPKESSHSNIDSIDNILGHKHKGRLEQMQRFKADL